MFVLQVLQILLLEALVLEEAIRLLLEVLADRALDRVDDLLVDITGEDVTIHLLDELDEAAEHLLVDCVSVRVGLDLLKHLIVGLPVVLKGHVVLDDQIDDVEVGENGTKVVEDSIVVLLLKAFLV